MDEATYAAIPNTMTLREVRFCVAEPGRRTQVLTVVTTLLDADAYTREDIAELYGFRWNSELDIRSIKQSLNLVHVRCKSPEMVRRELWTTILGYNLIRTTAAAAAVLHDKQPRHISFASTCEYVLASWCALLDGLAGCGIAFVAVPNAAETDRRLQSRRSPRPHRAARTQTAAPRLQAHARAPRQTPRAPRTMQLTIVS